MTLYIQRHSLLTRVTHGVAAISCILLAVTGLFVFWPELGGGLMGGEFTSTMRSLHRLLAIPFILVPLAAMIISPKGFYHMLFVDILGKWDRDDVKFASLFVPYLFHPQGIHMPPQHHVKGAQRLADGALLFAGIGLALSGLVLWAKTGIFGLTIDCGATALLVARWVHDICFVVTVIFGLGHIYLGGGIFQPYRGTANLMFGDGKVKVSDAVYHWGYWANEELTHKRNLVDIKDEK